MFCVWAQYVLGVTTAALGVFAVFRFIEKPAVGINIADVERITGTILSGLAAGGLAVLLRRIVRRREDLLRDLERLASSVLPAAK